jgi:phage terminase small subunit
METAKTLKIEGNYKGDNQDSVDPAPMMARVPQPPEGMNEIAAEFWRKKCIHLKQIGRLHAIDLDALECVANLYSDVRKTRQNMDSVWGTDMYLKHQKSHNEAFKLFMSAAKEFGFTPASRGKIKGVVEKKEEESEFDKI